MPPTSAPTNTRHSPRGFSLVEVILALGVMAIAIVSILGLIGTTLTNVRETEDIISGTATIGKMNALLENSVFWDGQNQDTKNESVYYWVLRSTSDSPTVFLFYDENPLQTNGPGGSAPMQRVVRFNVNSPELNQPGPGYAANRNDPNIPQIPVYKSLDDFIQAVAGQRVTGTVIAMTVSVSPLMSNFPKNGAYGNEAATYYHAPINGGLFPDTQHGLPEDPSGGGNNLAAIYPEGYFPILVQAFTVQIGNIQTTSDSTTVAHQILDNLSAGSLLYTYTTAKLR